MNEHDYYLTELVQTAPGSEKQLKFFAHVRHELRNPLNAIIGYSEILMEDAEEQGQLGFIPDLGQITKKARCLLQKINYYLDASTNVFDIAQARLAMLEPFEQILNCTMRLLGEAQDLGYHSYLAELEQIELANQSFHGLLNNLLTNVETN